MLTHNTELHKLIISWYEKLSHIKLTVEHSVFDPLPASAFGKPRSATDNAAEATDDFRFTFLLLIILIYLNKNTV